MCIVYGLVFKRVGDEVLEWDYYVVFVLGVDD